MCRTSRRSPGATLHLCGGSRALLLCGRLCLLESDVNFVELFCACFDWVLDVFELGDLGETMAVTFVIGNAHRISGSIMAPGTTISATIANEFTEAVGDLYTSALIALGLILFLITFIVLAAARYMLMRLNARIGV